VLDADVVVRADAAAAKLGGALPAMRGAETVARAFLGRAQAARPVLVDGELGFEVAPHGRRLLIVTLTFEGDRIKEIEAVADRASMSEMELTAL
jgi:RNA polymerase sigma-70 factor (ECF subfamily)